MCNKKSKSLHSLDIFLIETVSTAQGKIQKEYHHHESGGDTKRNNSGEKNVGWMIFHYFFPLFLTNLLKLSPSNFQVKFSRTDESTTSDGG